jgi:copper chaperone CopZ
MSETMYTVRGMTCEHCAGVVTAEVSGLAGVTGVDIDLAAGGVRVFSAGPVDDDAVRAVMQEAGCEVVS